MLSYRHFSWPCHVTWASASTLSSPWTLTFSAACPWATFLVFFLGGMKGGWVSLELDFSYLWSGMVSVLEIWNETFFSESGIWKEIVF